MTPRQFREHLEEVSQASADAMRARDRLREAEHRLTRPSSAHSDGTHVALGCVNRDAMLRRIEAAQQARERYGRLLSESIEVLVAFKEELSSSPLNDRACTALWSRHVRRMTFEGVGEELEVSTATAWRTVRDGEVVLAEHMGVMDAVDKATLPPV